MYLFIYIRIHTDMQQDVCSYNRYIRYTYYVYVYVCEGQCIHTLRYVTLRYVTLHYMHSSMHTYISMYTLIHLYTCMYRGLLQAVHRERTVKKHTHGTKYTEIICFLVISKSRIVRRESQPNKIRSFGPCLKPMATQPGIHQAEYQVPVKG